MIQLGWKQLRQPPPRLLSGRLAQDRKPDVTGLTAAQPPRIATTASLERNLVVNRAQENRNYLTYFSVTGLGRYKQHERQHSGKELPGRQRLKRIWDSFASVSELAAVRKKWWNGSGAATARQKLLSCEGLDKSLTHHVSPEAQCTVVCSAILLMR